MKKNLLLLFLLLVSYGVLQAQGGYIAPSPNAMAQFRQANAGLNYYTGAINVSIPLGKVKSRELETSVSLSYSSSGHRIHDIASPVGLGWTLSAGGMITRIVRGNPDDFQEGYCHDVRDTEPDMFFFSFMGRTGKFVLDRNGEAVLYPYQNLKIKAGICGYMSNVWYIMDEEGNQYIFGKYFNDNSIETTRYRPVEGDAPEQEYVSTWYLVSYKSLNGTDKILFTYTPSTFSYTNYFFKKNEDWCTGDIEDKSTHVTVATKYLTGILSHGVSIHFEWNDYREDVVGEKSLKSISITSNAGNKSNTGKAPTGKLSDTRKVLKKYVFDYSYFKTGNCGRKCLRLKLDRIYDMAPDPLYEFDYYGLNLPPRDSKHMDYMGYYNGNSVDSWLPAIPEFGKSGASREPNAAFARAAMLTKVAERGGAYKLFLYEGNTVWSDNSNTLVPGVRIKTIKEYQKDRRTIKEYSYVSESDASKSSGLIFRKPLLAKIIKSKIIERFSHSPVAVMDVNGTNLGYSRVEENIVGKGKTVYHFTNYDTRPDKNYGAFYTSVTSYFWERGNPLKTEQYDDKGTLLSRETYTYDFDLPIIRKLSANASTPADCPKNNKNYAPSTLRYDIISKPLVISSKRTEVFDQTDASNKRRITTEEMYTYDPETWQLVGTSFYNTATPDEKRLTKLKYVTHDDYDFRKDCEKSYSNCLQNAIKFGDRFSAEALFCYQDFSSCINADRLDSKTLPIQALRAKNAINTIVEQQNWLKKGNTEVFLGATLNHYKMEGPENTWVVPASVWSSKKSTAGYVGSSITYSGIFQQPGSFVLTQEYADYDNTYGKLLSETARDGVVTAYTYSNKSTTLERVTVNPGKDQQTTSYVHEPGVGVIKETDPNGRSTSIEYDFQGRVRLVRDHEGNIRERYRYHYTGQTPNLTIHADDTQVMTNSPVKLKTEDIVLPTGGKARFVWDMGNGTVYEDKESVSVSYDTPGLYTVRVIMFTNEFESYTKTIDILVNGGMKPYLCADGLVRYDICGIEEGSYGDCSVTGNTTPTDFELRFIPGNAGCVGVYDYRWEYRYENSNAWYNMPDGSSKATFTGQPVNGQPVTFWVRCTVTDACGNLATAESSIEYYESRPGCYHSSWK